MEPVVTHGSFTLGRTIAAPVERVFAAFADKRAKEKWFHWPDAKPLEHTLDFRIGGSEHAIGRSHDGPVHRFEARYFDIVPDRRIIYAYEMYLDEKRISVSLTTVELQAQPDGQTYLQLSEDGAYLNGYDTLEARQRGTAELLEVLAASVSR